MFDKFFNKIKTYGEKIQNFESVLSSEQLNFVEILEKNVRLEKEIADRTEELYHANKSILTLKHIWSTMNSSEPLSEVLRTIADGMTKDLGYLHAIIFQSFGKAGNEYLKIREASDEEYAAKVKGIVNINPEDIYIPYKIENNPLIKCITTNEIVEVEHATELLEGFALFLPDEHKKAIEKLFSGKAISIIPIIFQDKIFGCMLVISIRSEISDIEKNFLGLFAKQIELAVTIADLFQTIKEQAITDGLTGLYNRRHFDQCLANETKRSLRLKQPFTLITLDLDHLKAINDNYGHSVGDAAIVGIAQILKQNARSIDLPSRFGGEEFGIVLPGIDLDGGLIAAERMRSAIENTTIEGAGRITASIGVGTFLTHTDNVEELLELVDQAMYRAKRNGRNQVQVAQPWDENIWKRQALDSLVSLLSRQMMPINQNLAMELIEKLRNTNLNDKNVDEIIFLVVDEFVNIYKPHYQRGNIKEKMEMIEYIAKELNISQEDIGKYKMAAMVYDIGNVMLPESILLKEGPLDEGERKKLLKHPLVAAKEILAPIGTASNIVALIEHWNENYDGSGYPGILKGDDIPVGTSILVAVNAYFALISPRPYRKAFDKQAALEILNQDEGKKWSPKVIEIINRLILAKK
ncbi:MAG: diguanylate cyclase [Candidatus Gastranaerophilales bacterium]|nr:diguanylate cyclase [Candidatus Gastranaerophilales bacterium]